MPSRSALPSRRSSGADPFDLWLRRSLHESWDATLEERVPDDLLRLFSDDRSEWEAMKGRWLKLAKSPDDA